MGCDIHLVREVLVGQKWIAVDTFQGHQMAYPKEGRDWSSPVARARNYRRFAALAGVRGDGPDPRGIPYDVSETTRYLIGGWGVDGHSHSWLPVADAARIFLETNWWGEPAKPDDYASKYPEAFFFGVDSEDAPPSRIVFWFDN